MVGACAATDGTDTVDGAAAADGTDDAVCPVMIA
jgi:hypothetical protein